MKRKILSKLEVLMAGAMQQKKAVHAIRAALVLGGCALASMAAAQTSPSDPQTSSTTTTQNGTQQAPANGKPVTLQGVTVTGSLIRSVDVETAQPITQISPEQLQQQGFLSTGSILQNLPSVGSPGTSGQGAGDVVGQYASLRGLGGFRTLILVDGERYTTDLYGQTDLTTIPSSLIDNVEILQDGASSVYGSDAIAGVINIHTKNLEGLYLDTYNSTYSPGNFGKQNQFSLSGGHKFSRGSVTFAITMQDSDQVMANQVWYARNGYGSLPQYPQTTRASNLGTIDGAVNAAGESPAVLANGPITVNPGQNGLDIANYHPNLQQYPSPYYGQDHYNEASLQTVLPGTSLHSYFLKGDYKLTDHIKAIFTGTYNTNRSSDGYGGLSLSPSTVGNGANLANALGLPAGSLGSSWYATMSPNSYYNPLPGYAVSFSQQTYNPYYEANNIKQYGFHTGLEGDFSLGENEYNWNVGYSDYRYINDMYGDAINLVHLYNAFGPSFMNSAGQVVCGTPGNVIGGCVPLNPFSGAGGWTQAEANYLNYNYNLHGWSQDRTVEANLSGDLFTLPQALGEGDVTFAVGADHRDMSGGVTPDNYTQLGINTNLAETAAEGSYGINEAYAELNVPLLKDMPGAQLLDFDVSHRFSRYSNFGDTNNNSYKLAWKPIDDLLFRASYGTGFRAPTISNLYGGTMQNFTYFTDPCDIVYGYTNNPVVEQRCLNGVGNLAGVSSSFRQLQASGQPIASASSANVTPFYTGANPNLRPETSKNYSAGIVYSPNWLSGLNVTLDYYRIRIDNVITLPSADSILDNCYILGELQQCDQFQRASNGQIINLVQAVVNEGFVDQRGTDLTLSYLFPDTPIGKFKIDTSGTYINSLYEQAVAGGQVVSYNLGAYDPVLGPVWRFRDVTNVNWSHGNFSATWTIRYFSSLQESCNPDNPALGLYYPCDEPSGNVQGQAAGLYRQGALAFNDAQFSWTAPWKGRISVGTTNIFNRRAPLSYTGVFQVAGPLGATGTDGYQQFAYNPQYDIGRVIYLKYSQQLF